MRLVDRMITPNTKSTKREFLNSTIIAGTIAISGCGGGSTADKEVIAISPQNARVGEPVSLTANVDPYPGNRYVWSLNDDWDVDEVGKKVTYRFNEDRFHSNY